MSLRFHTLFTYFDDHHQVRKGLQSLSQRIIGSSTILQGALHQILNATPPGFLHETVSQVYVNKINPFLMLKLIYFDSYRRTMPKWRITCWPTYPG